MRIQNTNKYYGIYRSFRDILEIYSVELYSKTERSIIFIENYALYGT